MKNATKHAEELKSLSRKLVRDYKPADKSAQEPLWALVRGAMSYDVPDSRVEDAIKVIQREFVDLNELRVAPFLKFHIDEGLKKELAVLDAIRKATEEDLQRTAGGEPAAQEKPEEKSE